MQFVADVHLGKLARQLRMAGFDTLWKDDFTDAELLRVSREERRVLLTRDRALHDQANPELRLYIPQQEPAEQLRTLVAHFELGAEILSWRGFLTRCLDCNTSILPVKPHQVADRLPGSLRLEHDEFFLCPRCERVFWKGSHFDRMREWMEKTIRE